MMAVAVGLLSLCMSSQALAQRGGFMQMMGGMQLDSAILAIKEVQEELKFTDEQMEEIGKKAAELNDTLRSEMREIMMGGGDRSEIDELMEELREEEQEFIALLNDDQKNRLKELRYQRMGTAMYQDEDVQTALGLSDDQKQAIEDAVQSSMDAMQDAMAEARDSGDFGSIRGKMQEMQKELAESLEGILSDKQKEQVVAMKGKVFEFPERRARRRGGRSDF
jgi:hypothetical protein